MAIHIKPSHRGSFTKKAHAHGKSVAAYAKSAKHSSNPKTRKQAVFAANARKWNHKGSGRK
jgi:hypothetical protein